MTLTGNFSALEAAIRQLDKIGDRSVFRGIAEQVGAEMVKIVDLEFRESKDPQDVPWAPLQSRNGQPLRDTGALANSFSSQVSGDSVSVGTNVSYAGYHQNGTSGRRAASSRIQPAKGSGKGFAPFLSKARAAKRKAGAIAFRELNFKAGGGKIPRRPFLPDDGPLPAKWDRGIADVIIAQIERLARGAA